MRLFIKNGMLVTAKRTFAADILVENGKISRVENPGVLPAIADTVIDATGMLLFPGGVDPHVHMHLLTPAGYSSDDFLSGSRAALFGGTTTLIDFVTPHKGEPLQEALARRKTEAAHCLTDYAFHMSPVEWRKSLSGEIQACVKEEGIPSFKVYMAYKDSIGLEDEDLQKVFRAVAEAGGMVTAHCEDGDAIEALRNRFVANGQTTPAFHPLSRPARLEAAAIKKAIGYAAEAGCPFYIVHVSAAASLEFIRKAQAKGQKVLAETCPHYLLLDDSRYQGNFEQAAPFVLSPPLRKKSDNRALWEALADGTMQSLGTDHCPFTMEQKRNGLHDFRKIANGAGSVEHRITLVYTYGVLQNKISLNRMVELTSTLPAQIFGLYPQKGALLPGSDADIVVWNPEKEKIISATTHHMHCDTDIYEGFKTQGAPEYVIARGAVVVENGRWKGSPLPGRFLKRKGMALGEM
jgi:dihydropyrimidinase